MKRALSMILAVVLLLSLAGCGTANDPSASVPEPEEEEEKLFTFRGAQNGAVSKMTAPFL